MDFNILECRRFIAPGRKSIIKRIVNNYEIDFYLGGKREIYVNGYKNDITENTLCVRSPGQTVYSFGDYNCYLLTLDFSMQTPTENYVRNAKRQIEPLCNSDLIKNLPQSFIPKHSCELCSLFELLLDQPNLNSNDSRLLVLEILFLINADSTHENFSKNFEKLTASEQAAKFIYKNFKNKLTLDIISKYVHLEKSYFLRVFKKNFGTTPIEYLIKYRLNYAQALLINTDMPISYISNECGYNNTAFFVTTFKNRFGISPGEYRNNARCK